MRAQRLILSVIIVAFCFSSIGWSACEGDLNCSGVVDGSDLAVFASSYGTTGCGTCEDVIAQINDLQSRVAQLEALLQHYDRLDADLRAELPLKQFWTVASPEESES